MKRTILVASSWALIGSFAHAQVPAVLPTTSSLPSINSIRPGKLAAGADGSITIYGLGYLGPANTLEVRWNGTPLASWSTVADEPDTQIVAIVPNGLLASDGIVTIARVSAGTTVAASNPVTVKIGTPESCGAGSPAECGAAIGDVPTIEIVPVQSWTPFVSAPAGGLVRVENRDFAEQCCGAHAVASTTFDPANFTTIPGKIIGDGRFSVRVRKPTSPTGPAQVGYFRVPEREKPGTVIPFFCPIHHYVMVTPLGALLVQ